MFKDGDKVRVLCDQIDVDGDDDSWRIPIAVAGDIAIVIDCSDPTWIEIRKEDGDEICVPPSAIELAEADAIEN